jgi:pilus assembly protein Flp/PilA
LCFIHVPIKEGEYSMNHIKREEGQGLVEYALLLVLVAIAVIIILSMVGDEVRSVYARVIAGLNGQTISGTGTEYAVTGFGVTVSGGPLFCTVTATNVQVAVFENGVLADEGVGASASAVASNGGGGSGSGSTDASGIATIGSLTSSNADCSGTMTVTSGGSSSSVSYSQ